MAFSVDHLSGQDQVADLQIGLQGAGKAARDDHFGLIGNIDQNRLRQQPAQSLFRALLADAGFQDQDCQPFGTAEARSTGGAGKSLLGSEFLKKGPRFSPQSEENAGIGDGDVVQATSDE